MNIHIHTMVEDHENNIHIDEERDDLEPVMDRDPFYNHGPRASGVNLRTVLICSGLAAILGMSGGTFFSSLASFDSHLSNETKIIDTEMVDYGNDINALRKANKVLTEKVATLEQTLDGLSVTDKSSLSDYEARVNRLENAAFEPQSLNNLEDILQRLAGVEALLSTLSTTTDSDDFLEINDRVDIILMDLENRIKTLEAVEIPHINKDDLNNVRRRLTQLEMTVQDMPAIIPPFPRDIVTAALEADKSSQDRGWLSRALGGQVKIIDADMLVLLERIEAHIARQDVQSIRQDVEALPESAQTALKPWLDSITQTGAQNE